MPFKENIINLIISQAQEIGLTYQINENNKCTIFIQENYTLDQLETGWISLVEGNPDMYIDDFDLLNIFKEWLE